MQSSPVDAQDADRRGTTPDPGDPDSGGPLHGMGFERLSDEHDLHEVAELEARCFTNPWSRDMLARELAQSDVAHVFLLRLPDRRLAGFCSCWIVADELHVNTLVIDMPYRQRRLGVGLMRLVMEEAARRGATRATLEVRESNEAARRLYASLGFQLVARRSRYYSQPEEDALILWHEHLAKRA
jgi:[ribosomal protein S18]-alanine N-acetyltransferase